MVIQDIKLKDIGKEINRLDFEMNVIYFTIRQILINNEICTETDFDNTEDKLRELLFKKAAKDLKEFKNGK